MHAAAGNVGDAIFAEDVPAVGGLPADRCLDGVNTEQLHAVSIRL